MNIQAGNKPFHGGPDHQTPVGQPDVRAVTKAVEDLIISPILDVTRVEGRAGASLRIHFHGGSIVATRRDLKAERKREAKTLHKLWKAGAAVPRFIALSDVYLIEEDLGGRSLVTALTTADGHTRLELMVAAFSGLYKIKALAQSAKFKDPPPLFGSDPDWLERFVLTPSSLSDLLGIAGPPIDYSAALKLLELPASRFVKWGASPCNAEVCANGDVTWFDWRTAGLGAGYEDVGFLISDENWPLQPAASLALYRRFQPDWTPEAETHLCAFVALLTCYRLLSIGQEHREDTRMQPSEGWSHMAWRLRDGPICCTAQGHGLRRWDRNEYGATNSACGQTSLPPAATPARSAKTDRTQVMTMQSPAELVTPVSAPPDGPDDGAANQRSAAHSLDLAEGLLNRGEISECVVALRAIDETMIAGKMLGRYNYATLATAIFGADTHIAALKILQSPEVFSMPALGYRFALQTGAIGRAKEIRASRIDLHAEFGWSASLRCLWDGKLKQGLQLYPHRHGAVNFGAFIPKGAAYQTLGSGDGDESDAMFLEQGIGDALLHLALMAKVRRVPPKVIVGPRQLETFVARFFGSVEFRRNGVAYDDLKGAKMHASGDYLAIAHSKMGGFRPDPFLPMARRPLFPKIGVCWRGGSAQNRREQRRYDLDHFLDLLPIGPSYVALQPDLLDEERALLRETGRIQTPDFDIRSDIGALFDMISGLAGVICVDSANLHLAGLARVPIYVLMNAKKHWYWGANGDVSDVYPSASVTPRHHATRADIQNWISRCEAELPRRGPVFAKKPNVNGPVLITGVPRSGTSMISNCLQQAGLWMGATIQANGDNPRGFFENREIRETILKPNLRVVGADPLGVHRLPDLARLASDPKLRERVLAVLSQQGHRGYSRWGYKEPKLSLSWPLWAEAFPEAQWVIVERDIEAVVKSCLTTGFMRRHSCDAEFWRTFASRYRERLDILSDTVPNVVRISSDEVIAGDCSALKTLAASLNLDWTQTCEAQIVLHLFNRSNRG